MTVNFRLQEKKMVFVTVDKNNHPVGNTNTCFEFSGEIFEKKSDGGAYILIPGITRDAEVRNFQLTSGNQRNEVIHKSKGETPFYIIKVDNAVEKVTMKIKLVDKSGQAIKNSELRFRYEKKEFDSTSGDDGTVVVEQLEPGAIIEVRQVFGNKIYPWHKFTVDASVDEYILHGEKPKKYANYSDNIDSQVRMKFRLVNPKGMPIPNVVIKLEYGYTVRHKYSNQFGEFMIDDALIGDKIKVHVDLRGNSTESEFICQEDNELHEIMLKTNKVSLYFWTIPIIALIAFLIYYATTGKLVSEESTEEEQAELPKKDTLIITRYTFIVSEGSTNQPIEDVKISLIYNDTLVQKVTDSKGFAEFPAFVHNLPGKFEMYKLGYIPVIKDFRPDSLFRIKMNKNDSINIDQVIHPCGIEVQSPGSKLSIKTFKMGIPKGRFNIWFNLFNVPTKVDIYKGNLKSVKPENLIYSTKAYLKGISNPLIQFESPDSLITVLFEGNAPKTTWVYKVYCARPPVKINPVPVQGQGGNNPPLQPD